MTIVAGLTVWETVQFHAGLYQIQADPTKPDVSPAEQRLQQAEALLQLMGLQKTMHTQVMHSFHQAHQGNPACRITKLDLLACLGFTDKSGTSKTLFSLAWLMSHSCGPQVTDGHVHLCCGEPFGHGSWPRQHQQQRCSFDSSPKKPAEKQGCLFLR